MSTASEPSAKRQKIAVNNSHDSLSSEEEQSSESQSTSTQSDVESSSNKKKYRLYSQKSISDAYVAVMTDGLSLRAAAKKYGVPAQTLRDRVTGRISLNCVTTGRSPVLDIEEETRIVEHLVNVSRLGYGFNRQEITDLASDYALQLGKRDDSDPFTLSWFRSFRKRWDILKVLMESTHEYVKAKRASPETVNRYILELDCTLTRYNLQSSPHLIYNIDEKGFILNKTPPFMVQFNGHDPPPDISGKSYVTTVIGAGSASGVTVPPFFVFPEQRMKPDLLKDCSPGVDGAISSSGCSNADIFRRYLKEHFVKHIPRRKPGQHLLLILDGHVTHVAVDLVEWAESQNIIILLLPAHTSHILQPLECSCYGPLEQLCNNLCHNILLTTSSLVTKKDICGLLCKAYSRALVADNLISGFKKTGVYPFNKKAIASIPLTPLPEFVSDKILTDVSEHTEETVVESSQQSYSSDSENQSNKELENHHIICLYDEPTEDEGYPRCIRFGSEAEDIVMVSMVTKDLTFQPLVLEENQKKMFECYCKCVEEMFTGLEFSAGILVDKSSTQNERLERCDAVISQYGLADLEMILKPSLIHLYLALTDVFDNSSARTALTHMINSLLAILKITHYNINCGGTSLNGYGVSEVLSLKTDTMMGLTLNEQIDKCKQECDITQACCNKFKYHIPDFVLMNKQKRKYLYGVCNSKTSAAQLLELEEQTWLQALDGFFDSDSVYGCGINPSTIVLMQLKMTHRKNVNTLETSCLHFKFIDMECVSEDITYPFDVKVFKDALQSLMFIIKENDK